MNSSSIPISIIWSRMNQNIDSVIFSVDVKEISIPKLKRCTLNISPSNDYGKSFSGPVNGRYFDLEDKSKFDWLILALGVMCTVLPPCISYLIINITWWDGTACWNLNQYSYCLICLKSGCLSQVDLPIFHSSRMIGTIDPFDRNIWTNSFYCFLIAPIEIHFRYWIRLKKNSLVQSTHFNTTNAIQSSVVKQWETYP